MGTEFMRVGTTEGNDEFPPVPPGFESFASFTLKKVEDAGIQDKDHTASCSASNGASNFQPTHMKSESDISDSAKLARSQRRRPLVNYGQYDESSEDENDSAQLNQIFSVRPSLPKGVIRGCPECIRCQKVTARWRPRESRRPDLADAPAFYPTEEEFEDPLKYIATIRPKAEQFGICRIVPPSSWKVPCPLREKSKWESSKFSTRVQRVDKLQNRGSMKRMHRNSSHTGRKRRRCARMGLDYGTGKAGVHEAETFGFEPGPEFTLDQFQKYADDFKVQYFGNNEYTANNESSLTKPQQDLELSVQDIEGEYWRMVEKPTEEIEVLYGADLETGAFGSGFPKLPCQDDSSSHDKYTKSGWNLNNFPRLPGSVLSYEESDISGVLVPWLYIGMCFSSFCWHVEDHHLYSLNYMHWGAPKMWYGIPAKNAPNLEEAMRKHLPDLFEEQPDLLHKLVTQLSPTVLKSEGVPVFRCLQNPGEFILTFPRAYHSGFNCGFNCAEAVNVAPVDWLPHGQIAVELYRDQGRRTSISHDKLLLGAAREAVKAYWEFNLLKKNTCENLKWIDICGKDGVLAKALRARVEMERVRREYLCKSSRTLKMESSFDATDERECVICLFDLHLSAAGCHCSPDKYACLNHAKQLCSCNLNTKFFLFRYEISELNILVEALEGKLSSIYRWARLDLGLALSSHISRDSLPLPRRNEKSPQLFNSIELKQENSQKSVNILDCTQRKDISKDITLNSNGLSGGRSSQQGKKSLENSKDTKASSSTDSFITKITALKMSSVADNDNVILLSDDENDEPEKLCPNEQIRTSGEHSIISDKLVNCDNKAVSSSCDENSLLATSLADPGVKCQGDAISSSIFPGRKNDNSPIHLRNKKEDHSGISKSSSDLPPSNVSRLAGCSNTKFVLGLSSVRQPLNCSVANVGNRLQHHLRHVKEEHNENLGPSADLRPSNSFCLVGSSNVESSKNGQSVSSARDPGDCPSSNARNGLQHPQPCGSGKHSIMDKHELMGRDAPSNSVDIGRSLTGSQPCSQNHADRYFRHKGPRIARIVRKSNLNVVPVDYGVVISGKSWCSSQAIFPKGFRSRVRYISILDPTSVCYYISEILDTGRGRPLFMVSLEDSPNEVFVHVTATRCWDMVRDRVNQEIARQHKLGKANLPPLQPPGSLNGLEMFGFLSPAIIRAVEAMDQNKVCAEYWDSRLVSRSQVPVLLPKVNGGNAQETIAIQNDEMATDKELPGAVDTVLKGLFKKANLEELRSLYSILGDSSSTADRCLVSRLLHEELQNLPK